MKTCAVIPAAGRGTRLGSKRPKILSPLTGTETVWSVLRRKLLSVVEHIHLVVAPAHEQEIATIIQQDREKGIVSLSVQPQPIGMGDAIFQGYPVWSQAENILVVWGDQVFVSEKTLASTLTTHQHSSKTITLPLVEMRHPYVEYIFNAQNQLTHIKQSREGEVCSEQGLADVGTFALSVAELALYWQRYLDQLSRGAQTGEINFLPFLPYLATQGWQVRTVRVADQTEARGINTPEDLLFFQEKYEVKQS